MPTTKFCTLDQVKSQLNTLDGYSGDDTSINEHIKNATALIRTVTRRNWETGTHTQYFDTQDINIAIRPGSAMARFSLKEKPLQSITSVKYNTGGNFTDTDALTEGVEYVVDTDRNQLIMYPSYMSRNLRSLQVVYVAGYTVDTTDTELLLVDHALATACAIQAAFTWRRVVNETSGKSQKQDKKGYANYRVAASGLVMEAQAMLRDKTRLLTGHNG